VGSQHQLKKKKKECLIIFIPMSRPQRMTAADYIKDFYQLLKKELKFPLFIVGGTGFLYTGIGKRNV